MFVNLKLLSLLKSIKNKKHRKKTQIIVCVFLFLCYSNFTRLHYVAVSVRDFQSARCRIRLNFSGILNRSPVYPLQTAGAGTEQVHSAVDPVEVNTVKPRLDQLHCSSGDVTRRSWTGHISGGNKG